MASAISSDERWILKSLWWGAQDLNLQPADQELRSAKKSIVPTYLDQKSVCLCTAAFKLLVACQFLPVLISAWFLQRSTKSSSFQACSTRK